MAIIGHTRGREKGSYVPQAPSLQTAEKRKERTKNPGLTIS